MSAPSQVDVRLLALPVDVYAQAHTHAEALQREFDVLESGPPHESDVPSRLLALIDELNTEFGGASQRPREDLAAAVERGDAAIDITYRVPTAAGEGARELNELLDEADRYCRDRELLTTLPSIDAVRFRHWFLGEFIRQTRGKPPIPWPAFEEAAPAAAEYSDAHPVAPPRDAAAGSDQSATSMWTLESGDGDPLIVRLTGDLDLEASAGLRELLRDAVERGTTAVLVDVSDVRFIDSVGLSVLVAGHNRCAAEDCRYAIRAPDRLRRTFHIAGLETLLEPEDARGGPADSVGRETDSD